MSSRRALARILAAAMSIAAGCTHIATDRAWWSREGRTRPAQYPGFVRSSFYLPMRDGVRLAVDHFSAVTDAPLLAFFRSRLAHDTPGDRPRRQARSKPSVAPQVS
ncbi:MAG: hypothetical protein HY699_23700 [Deltaproteobacteria bacterium]|nr:hypothetical protein [Deltaproteobacteria bacterium]